MELKLTLSANRRFGKALWAPFRMLLRWPLVGIGVVYLWTLPMFHCNGWCFPWSVTSGMMAKHTIILKYGVIVYNIT